MIIGLSGYATSGKDEIAKVLVQRHGFRRVAFADALKECARNLGWNNQKDEKGRVFLQELGSVVRNYKSDTWVKVVEGKIHHSYLCDLVISDVRYQNEVDMILHHGGKIVKVVRPGVVPVNNHHSECVFDSDITIVNCGTLEDLAERTTLTFKALKESK